ncbi:ankyrin repeat domain-containing protein [Aspergillus candidus]|uniref:Ankyrin repeat-containing domain protein n=1 Tax=Aspergillus candidus TaxID=41067 RepID=A0A2I2FI84_ASPCN|nr:ankyrin repeat-containing domain protein [Aspergillus candidus]PLB40333.1 ankyrin repeat-containing domain protein [Aspergillus candidus]
MPMIRMFLNLPNVNPNVHDRLAGQTVLMTAIRQGDMEMVRWLLEKNMVDINARNSAGETALMRAVTMYDLETVRLLVEVYGADITARTKYGATALDWAERYRWTIDEVIRLLSPKRVRVA